MKARHLVLVLIPLLVASLAVITSQHQLISRLRLDLQSQPPATPQTPTAPPAQPNPDTSIPAETDARELLRLRNEVQHLRTQAAELENVRLDNARLKVELDPLKRAPDARLVQFASTERKPGAWIGLNVAPLEQPGGLPDLILVHNVARDSPAAEAQVQEGDIVLRVNNEVVTNVEQFQTRIASWTAGQPVVLQVLRENAAREISVIPRPPP